MRTSIRLTVWPLLAAMSLVLVLACEKPLTESELKVSLGEVAQEYWIKRLMNKDYQATYGMEAAEGDLPFSDYLVKVHNAGQIQYLAIKTDDVKVEKDNGFVDLMMTCRIAGVPKDLNLSFLKDRWILKSGKWKHVLKKK